MDFPWKQPRSMDLANGFGGDLGGPRVICLLVCLVGWLFVG